MRHGFRLGLKCRGRIEGNFLAVCSSGFTTHLRDISQATGMVEPLDVGVARERQRCCFVRKGRAKGGDREWGGKESRKVMFVVEWEQRRSSSETSFVQRVFLLAKESTQEGEGRLFE